MYLFSNMSYKERHTHGTYDHSNLQMDISTLAYHRRGVFFYSPDMREATYV